MQNGADRTDTPRRELDTNASEPLITQKVYSPTTLLPNTARSASVENGARPGHETQPREARDDSQQILIDDQLPSRQSRIAPQGTGPGSYKRATNQFTEPILIDDVSEVADATERALGRRQGPLYNAESVHYRMNQKRMPDLSPAAESKDDELEVISELPACAVRDTERRKRRRQKRQERAMHQHSLTPTSARVSRPRSADYSSQPSYSDYGSYGNLQQMYGSSELPIDLDEYESYGEGSSRPQTVNGKQIGIYRNGAFLPFRTTTYASDARLNDIGLGASTSVDQTHRGPEHMYSGTYLSNSHAGHNPSSYLQGRPFTSSALNEFSRNSMPEAYNGRRLEYDRYQDAYHSDQISAEDLQKLLSNIKDRDIPPELRDASPTALTKTLMEHQRIGLTWLKAAEEGTSKGGILADAMGLGKTIQAISLILSRPAEDRTRMSTLVVAPVALLRQWEREIRAMTYPTPSVYIHHGVRKLQDITEILKFDIVLTSFNTIGYEEAQNTRYEELLSKDPSKAGEKPRTLMIDTPWYRVILDEAHTIKNKNTRGAKGCGNLQATYRWALTGTPMQNSVDELYSLISFLRIKPYNDYRLFVRDIAKPLTRKDDHSVAKATKKLQALLTAIMLRRTKDSEIDGQAILKLPMKHTIVDHVIMETEERSKYTELETGARRILQRTMQEDKSSTGSSVLVLLLKLRQTCDHPLLSGTHDNDITTLSTTQGISLARTLRPEVVQRLKVTAMEGFECPVCFDVATSGVAILVPCGHYYCGECLIQQLESSNRTNDAEEQARCPQCRNPFDLKDCISFNHFRKAHLPELYTDPDESDSSSENTSEAEFRPESSHANLTLNLKNKGKQKQKLKGHKNQSISDRFRQKFDINISEFTQSAKIKMILSLVLNVRQERPGEKTIVFSQFTSFLDLVEIPLRQSAINFLRYDGSLDAVKRNDALVTFEDDPSYNVILVSLKAGNVGLNLTCANHVILSEPFWNPYVEDQAVDRSHRIGQSREVFIHRLIIEDSVESRVLNIQNTKRKLIEGAMDPAQSAAITKLGRNEIAYLFGLGTGNNGLSN